MDDHPTPQIQVAPDDVETAARIAASRRTVVDFTSYTDPSYVSEPVHDFISDTLGKIVAGELNHVMIFAPPQHGKSKLVSVHFPPFWFGHRPNDPILSASYSDRLVRKHSGDAMAILGSPEYKKVFPGIRIKGGTGAKDFWGLDKHRGEFLATTVEGQITGFGGLLGIIDDPFKNWKDAQSEAKRDLVWDWYRSTFHTRFWAGAAIVIINTRWHEDDLCGRLLRDQPGVWTVLRLPAIAETPEERTLSNKATGLNDTEDILGRAPGEALSPKRHPIDKLKRDKEIVGGQMWYALYQGSPRQPEGERFKRAWFKFVNKPPMDDVIRRVRYWDLAANEETGKARTVGLRLALTKTAAIVEDVVKGNWSPKKRNSIIDAVAAADNEFDPATRNYFEQEPGSSGKEVAMQLIAMVHPIAAEADKVSGSKDVRLEPVAAMAEAGGLKLVKSKWNIEFIDEITAIPNGTVRDQGDALSGAYNKAFHAGKPAGARVVPIKRGPLDY